MFRRPGQHGGDDITLYDALRACPWHRRFRFDYALQDAFPHDVLMDLNGGLLKGCYVGQEVVSRMQHAGQRRRVVTVSSTEPLLRLPGTEITANGKPIGTLGSVTGHRPGSPSSGSIAPATPCHRTRRSSPATSPSPWRCRCGRRLVFPAGSDEASA